MTIRSPHVTPPGPLVEVLDNRKRLLLVMPLEEARRQALPHRAVMVLVFDAARNLVLARRGPARTPYPGRWDVSASGWVAPGEAVRDAAARALESSLGLRPDRLRPLAELDGGPETGHEQVSLFVSGRTAQKPRPDPDLVQEVYAFAPEELAHLMTHFRELLAPSLVLLWERGLTAPPRSEG